MLMLLTAALSFDNTEALGKEIVGPTLEAAQTQLLSCTAAQVQVHFQDDSPAQVIAEDALRNCKESWDIFLSAYRTRMDEQGTSPKVREMIDMSGNPQRAALVGGLIDRILKLRQAVSAK